MVCAMAVPGVIPVAYEPKHRTETIGRYAEGQFLASITYAFPEGFHLEEGWEEQKRLYAVLHTFDTEGNYPTRTSGAPAPGRSSNATRAVTPPADPRPGPPRDPAAQPPAPLLHGHRDPPLQRHPRGRPFRPGDPRGRGRTV